MVGCAAMPRQTYIRPLDLKHGRIDMSHGAGGRAGAQLVDELFPPSGQRISAPGR